eukprot:UN10815
MYYTQILSHFNRIKSKHFSIEFLVDNYTKSEKDKCSYEEYTKQYKGNDFLMKPPSGLGDIIYQKKIRIRSGHKQGQYVVTHKLHLHTNNRFGLIHCRKNEFVYGTYR